MVFSNSKVICAKFTPVLLRPVADPDDYGKQVVSHVLVFPSGPPQNEQKQLVDGRSAPIADLSAPRYVYIHLGTCPLQDSPDSVTDDINPSS